MKKYLGLFLLFIFIKPAYAQKIAYFPRNKADKKEHERAVLSLPDGLIAIGSNLANVRILDPSLHVLNTIALGTAAQEIRDLAFCASKLFAMQSNDSSSLYRVSLQNKEVEKINLNWQGKPIFFDGIASENNTLFLIGDPVNGTFCTFRSLDGGSN